MDVDGRSEWSFGCWGTATTDLIGWMSEGAGGDEGYGRVDGKGGRDEEVGDGRDEERLWKEHVV